ncbi:hypothetical protein RJ641_003338 [Dillenia turbinata]|uniref:AB hydrolase-1 domain-containing protein n=1 Tax=Dillenia turbinata TaxID=194707 RepID=A0AAN8ZE57_9MAGN
MIGVQPDVRFAVHMAVKFGTYNTRLFFSGVAGRRISLRRPALTSSVLRVSAFSNASTASDGVVGEKVVNKPSICTADELHYVKVPNSDWKLALWRYLPSPKAPTRNHPLLLLSGVATNAIGFDLCPGSSFARYMCDEGFDTWILEVRGAGLSLRESDAKNIEHAAHEKSEQIKSAAATATNEVLSSEQQSMSIQHSTRESDISVAEGDPMGLAKAWDESRLVSKLSETLMQFSERLSGFLSESQLRVMYAKFFDQISKLFEDSHLTERVNEIKGKILSLLESRQNSTVASQIRDLSQRLVDVIEEGQQSVSPRLFDLQERLTTTLDDFQKQLDLIVKYDWDFDDYLEEDVPSAMDYIRSETKPQDGRLLAIGHSMGGILLYAMLSRCGRILDLLVQLSAFEGRDSKLAAVVTLASSLDYTSSNSALKLLLPIADPAQALNVPVVPLGALLAVAYPLSSRPPYVLSWLNHMISAPDMMHPELLKKLVMNNFCTVPVKLLLQLTSVFREGGLRDRSGTFLHKEHLHKSNVPILALAADQDLICPPEAVYETVKIIPEHLVSYKVFGHSEGPHYAHYDLVGGRMAVNQVYPCIVEFLGRTDLR